MQPARWGKIQPVGFAFAFINTMKSCFVFFPFDLFGSAGAGAGVTLLADELREILADNRRERVPTRASCYTDHVRQREFHFETLDAYADWRRQGRQAVRQVLHQGDFLFWITGNHLGALPVYDELAGNDDTLVVQFDAHLDIHHFRDCTSELSHGNFLLHCAGTLPPLMNLGHRDLLLMSDYIEQLLSPHLRRGGVGDRRGAGPCGIASSEPRGTASIYRCGLRCVRSGVLSGRDAASSFWA